MGRAAPLQSLFLVRAEGSVADDVGPAGRPVAGARLAERGRTPAGRAAIWIARGDACTARGDDRGAATFYRRAVEELREVDW